MVMDELVAIFPGIVGTAMMSAFTLGFSALINRPFPVVKILGTMLTFRTTVDGHVNDSRQTFVIGTLYHYLVGIFFSSLFFWHLKHSEIVFTGYYLFLLSVGIGIVAMIVWYGFIKLHPSPPKIPLPPYVTSIFLGHLIFGLGVYITVASIALFYQLPISLLYIDSFANENITICY